MDFTQFLPYDVLCQIFSANPFTNEDCVEFTKVCRSWRSDVPEYTTILWRKARISGDTWAKTDMHVARFLGPHVHEVFIDSCTEEACKILQVLEMLTLAECFYIQKLVFRLCTFTLNHRILWHIRRLGHSNLSELAFIQHRTNLPFKATIAACPQLTRFFYSVASEQDTNHIDYNGICSREPVISGIDNVCDDTFINMACLSIDVPVSYAVRLEPILKKCPNLRVLRVGDTDVDRITDPSAAVINITGVFRWCRYLNYLECNNSCKDPLKMTWWTTPCRPLDHEQQSGLQEFVYYEGFQQEEAHSALHHITLHHPTLQSLTIGRKYSSYSLRWDHLQLLNFPQLQSLKLFEACIGEQALASLIAHCPNLEVVYLDTYPLFEFYPSVFNALQMNARIRDLTVDYKFAGDPLHGGGWESDTRFEMLTPLCKYLDAMTDRSLERLQVNFNHSLDVLHARFLSAVASVKSIETFALCNRLELYKAGESGVTESDTVAFIHRLGLNTRIRTLTFAQLDFLYPSVFHTMGELEHLTGLLFNNCTYFTAQDVVTLLEKTKSLEHLIIIDNRAIVSPDLSSFAYRITQCSYTAGLVSPNMILIKQSD